MARCGSPLMKMIGLGIDFNEHDVTKKRHTSYPGWPLDMTFHFNWHILNPTYGVRRFSGVAVMRHRLTGGAAIKSPNIFHMHQIMSWNACFGASFSDIVKFFHSKVQGTETVW